eukprot:CAMPEP_0115006088 /NCGR_PEP_ID=MMETSP0216-20121206/20273_1 /TAXON_ID=223996 /ORGANISM="Protocruzia adherens, Strain Boccale" /LENGTH=56 /DNA_ID=CAMNT_0002372567 /DNA_START=587 /DNA_END=757 /DNA_ORIENTATION=+
MLSYEEDNPESYYTLTKKKRQRDFVVDPDHLEILRERKRLYDEQSKLQGYLEEDDK